MLFEKNNDMKHFLFFITLILFTLLSQMLTAQEEHSKDSSKVEWTIATDFQTRYVWRGLLLGGSSPSLQPQMFFSWKGLTVGTWGAFSFNSLTIQELDLYISYTFWKEMFSVYLYDYCFPNEAVADFNYFNYQNATTSHVFEAGVAFNGVEKVPISVSVFVNLYGADAKKATGKNIFSSYAEVSYNPTIKKAGIDLSIFAGAALNGQSYRVVVPDIGYVEKVGYYGNKGFAVINLGIKAKKEFRIGDKVSFPISTGLIFNPCSKKTYLVGSIGFAL